MSGNAYSARIAERLVADRQQDEVIQARAEANRVKRRQAFAAAVAWLDGALLAQLNAAAPRFAAMGLALVCTNNFSVDGEDAYKHPFVCFGVRDASGAVIADFEVFVSHGLITVNQTGPGPRRKVTAPGFSAPQLVGGAGEDLARAMVELAITAAQTG